MNHENLVKSLCTCFDNREFNKAKEYLHDQFEAFWVCTEGKFDKKDFILVNKEYPGKWNTKL